MKNKFKKLLAAVFTLVFTFTLLPASVTADSGEVIVLYTNDVHCGIDDYSKLAAYRAQLIADGNTVITIDAGDAIQGEVIGTLTSGSAIIDLMNTVGYDYAVPGNHEFDYGMDTYLNLAHNEANFKYLCSNFIDLQTNSTVFDAYDIIEVNGEKIAFVGIATPESYTKSTPAYFQDENGNLIYNFAQNDFYATIQSAVDSALENGADRVVAVGHLGISGTTDGWKSTDVIANTTGIDVFLDAHTHEVIEENTYQNKNGEDVILSSTGTKLAYFGELTLELDGTEHTELITPDSVDVSTLTDTAKTAYDEVQGKIDSYNAETAYLYEVLGTTEVELSLNDLDGNWCIRQKETNMGDFVADAYRSISGADIALVNAGGIRASIPAGEVTRKSLMDVNPWNNEMCVIEATGQQILDALEHGASNHPESYGGFLHVSGLSYEIHSYRETPVVFDDMNNFAEVDNAKQRRVENVKIGGIEINPDKTYTVTGNYYMLKNGGDGFTMFKDCKVVKHDELPTDSEMLIQYFTKTLGGKVTAEQYGNIMGDGRINIYTSEKEVPVTTPDNEQPTTTATENVTVTTTSALNDSADKSNPSTGAPTAIATSMLALLFSAVVLVTSKKK